MKGCDHEYRGPLPAMMEDGDYRKICKKCFERLSENYDWNTGKYVLREVSDDSDRAEPKGNAKPANV